MKSQNVIEKLKKSGLSGRSGSGFPTGLKWEIVKKTKARKKYIICNASEGEPDVFKDSYILEKHPEEVIEGIKIALRAINGSGAYIYLRKDNYFRFKKKLEKIIGEYPIVLFKKQGGYIAGEESAVCEAIEGNRPEPRQKPPFVSEAGLFGCPTLVNNVETFYWASKVYKGEYKKNRFYSVSGDIKKRGVYEFPESWPVEKILKEAKNWPEFKFFVKVGGGACGKILSQKELNIPVCGAGAIVVFDSDKTDLISLMKKWVQFFHEGNCDKCVPCREGVLRIKEILNKKEIDKKTLEDIFFVLEETSFCSLGKGIPQTFRDLINKV